MGHQIGSRKEAVAGAWFPAPLVAGKAMRKSGFTGQTSWLLGHTARRTLQTRSWPSTVHLQFVERSKPSKFKSHLIVTMSSRGPALPGSLTMSCGASSRWKRINRFAGDSPPHGHTIGYFGVHWESQLWADGQSRPLSAESQARAAPLTGGLELGGSRGNYWQLQVPRRAQGLPGRRNNLKGGVGLEGGG